MKYQVSCYQVLKSFRIYIYKIKIKMALTQWCGADDEQNKNEIFLPVTKLKA